MVVTSPSAASWRRTSRIVVRETPVCSINSRSTRRCSGLRRISTIAWRSWSTTCSRTGAATRLTCTARPPTPSRLLLAFPVIRVASLSHDRHTNRRSPQRRRHDLRGLRRSETDRAAHAGPAQAAVAVGDLRQVLLVVVLGVVELAKGRDLGRDLAVAGLAQALGERGLRRLRGRALGLGAVEDGRAVLGAHVVALAHALGRVVVLPEELEDLLVGDLLGVEDDQHGLRVAGLAAAGLFVGRVGRVAARVADRGRVDALGLPEHALRAPEAAHADDGGLQVLRERRLDRRAEDGVRRGGGNRVRAAGKGVLRLHHAGLRAKNEHMYLHSLSGIATVTRNATRTPKGGHTVWDDDERVRTVTDMFSPHQLAFGQIEAERAFKATSRRRRQEALTVHDEHSLVCRTPGRDQVREIPLERILGTFDAGRARDFDGGFRPAERTRRRWLSVWRADTTPPITVMELCGAYAVVDGHHRVSVARARGEATITAVIA